MSIDYWEKRSIPEPNTGCWLWELSLFHNNRYGQCTVDSKAYLAHRYSYIYHKGDIPNGNIVRHTCDQPSCVNPEHLILGSHKDNSMDMKNRNRSLKGSKNHQSILLEYEVRVIKSDNRLDRLIAKEYGVSRSTINAIKISKTWTHI